MLTWLKTSIQKLRGNSLAGKSMMVLILRMLGVLLFFSLTLFLTNNFHPSDVGKYDFSRALLIFLGTAAVFGTQQSIIYYSGFLLSKNNLGYIRTIYVKMVLIVFAISIFMVLVTYLLEQTAVLETFGVSMHDMAFKTVMTIFFYGITMLNIDAFRAVDRIFVSEVFRNILRYLFFFIAVVLLFFNVRSAWLVDVFLFNFVFLAILSTLFLFKQFKQPILHTNENSVRISYRDILKRSAPMAVSAASFLLMQSLDVLMLTSFTDYETVAYYSAAVKLTLLISIVLSSVNAVIAPQIARDFSDKNMGVLKRKIKRSTWIIFAMTLPIILLLGLFSSFVLGFFGESYTLANTSLLILLLGQAVNAFCGSIGVYLNMTGKQQVFQIILVFALVINVVLNYVLIPKYGMEGAAIATASSMILWNMAAVIYVYRTDKVKTFLSI